VGHLDGYYRAAGYVDKILRRANPAELPIALPTELIFSVNRSALKDIGLTLPKEIATVSPNGSHETGQLNEPIQDRSSRCSLRPLSAGVRRTADGVALGFDAFLWAFEV
jgi:hypothetical protein